MGRVRLRSGRNHLLEQLGGAPVHFQFGLQLGDAPTSRDELGQVGRGDAPQLPRVDELLTTPVVDRLITDLKVVDQLRDRTARLQQVEHFAPELGWYLLGMSLLYEAEAWKSTNLAPANPGNIICVSQVTAAESWL